MADEENIDGPCSRGADWEVVALTASAYAASPGPEGGLHDDSRNKDYQGECDSSSVMFMSEHFVFPPHEHENLPVPLESDDEFTYQPGNHCIIPAEEEHSYFYEFHEDSSETDLSVPNVEYQEDQTKSFIYAKTDCLEMDSYDDENDIDAMYDSPNLNKGMSPDFDKFQKRTDGKNGGYNLPNDAWWKRHAMSLYKQAKETNTFWSICMAAALMGLVVLGRQWQREKLQFEQLKLQLSITNERMGRMLGSVSRFKDALIGSHHRSCVIHAGASSADL